MASTSIMRTPDRVFTVTFPGEAVCCRVVQALVKRSQWFLVEPQPDDEWVVCVKVENTSMLEEILDTALLTAEIKQEIEDEIAARRVADATP